MMELTPDNLDLWNNRIHKILDEIPEYRIRPKTQSAMECFDNLNYSDLEKYPDKKKSALFRLWASYQSKIQVMEEAAKEYQKARALKLPEKDDPKTEEIYSARAKLDSLFDESTKTTDFPKHLASKSKALVSAFDRFQKKSKPRAKRSRPAPQKDPEKVKSKKPKSDLIEVFREAENDQEEKEDKEEEIEDPTEAPAATNDQILRDILDHVAEIHKVLKMTNSFVTVSFKVDGESVTLRERFSSKDKALQTVKETFPTASSIECHDQTGKIL